jgi:hypothetical protein
LHLSNALGSPIEFDRPRRRDGLIELSKEEEMADEKSNIDEYMVKMWEKPGIWGDDPTYANIVE